MTSLSVSLHLANTRARLLTSAYAYILVQTIHVVHVCEVNNINYRNISTPSVHGFYSPSFMTNTNAISSATSTKSSGLSTLNAHT